MSDKQKTNLPSRFILFERDDYRIVYVPDGTPESRHTEKYVLEKAVGTDALGSKRWEGMHTSEMSLLVRRMCDHILEMKEKQVK